MTITKKYFQLLVNQELESIMESFRGFNLKKFSSITNSVDRYKYLKNLLPEIGQGSSRVVFGIGKGKVIKLAGSFTLINYLEKKGDLITAEDKSAIESRLEASYKKGIAQNQEEVDIFTNPKIKPITTKIFDYSNDFTWLIAEAVREVKLTEFEKVAQVPIKVFENIIYTKSISPNLKDSLKELSERYFKDFFSFFKDAIEDVAKRKFGSEEELYEFLNEVIQTDFYKAIFSAMEMGLISGDIERLEHWGKTTDNRVVIMDYGLTENTKILYGF